ncbi:MAG: hypothetical protein A2X22_10770 [Bacteroidetes bacterium GWF2_49_14]|nr:MAG: hypothetical protein A2X22_10770 [Bacteroidetes bacterium GWF2_49_14]
MDQKFSGPVPDNSPYIMNDGIFRNLVESSIVGVFRSTTEGTIQYVNDAIVRMLEFDNRDELVQLGAFMRYKYPEQRVKMIELLKEHGHVKGFEATILTKKGNERVLLYSLVLEGNIINGTLIDLTDRVEADRALRESEEVNRLLFENSGEAILFTKPDGTIYSANPEACRILGRSEMEIKGLGRSGILDTNDPRLPVALKKRKTSGQFKGELNMLKKNGTVFPAELSSTVFMDSHANERTGIFFRDISDRKRVQAALQHSKRELSTLMDNLPGMVYSCLNDHDWTMKFMSEGAYELTGYLPDELLESKKVSFNDIIHPDDVERVWEMVQAAVRNNQSYDIEYRIITKSGLVKQVWERGQINSSEESGFELLEGFITDITDHKKAEESLRKSQLLLKSSLESQKDTLLLSIDREYRYLYFNKTHADVMKFAYGKEISIGMNILECITTVEDRITAKENYDRALKGETHSNIRVYGDINLAYYESFFNPIINEENEIVGATGLARIINDRIKAEQEIQQQNEELQNLNATKDKFFSIIAHDLRSPFNSFMGLTQVIAEDLPSLTMSEVQKMAESMSNSATNLYRLLENLLQWSQIQKGAIPFNPVPLDLKKAVDQSLELIHDSAKIKEIDISIDIPDKSIIYADKDLLQTIFRNLVSNATKFSHRGGKVQIIAKAATGEGMEVLVRDCGIGMKPSMVESLFRIDVSNKRQGTEGEPSTGLGLILCKEFIEKHGGKIRVESKPGQGTTIFFNLPPTK